MSQSYPWFKLPHREYLLSLSYKVLKPVERLAFIELVMFAHTQENNALPDNDKFLAAWASMSLKQWLKVKANVFTEWSLVDGFWQLPKWFVIEQPTKDTTQHNDNTQENYKPLTNAERCKRYRDSKKNVGDTNTDTSSDTQNMSSDTTATRTQHDSDTTKSVDSVSFGGIKGGDLDLKQDLDLDQEFNSQTKTREAEKKSSRFFDDELRPDVNALNAKLGANLVTEEFITQNLFSFNSHYETQQLTDNQRLAKWINWFKGNKAKESKFDSTSSQSSTRKNTIPDNNSQAWMTPELEAQLNAKFAA